MGTVDDVIDMLIKAMSNDGDVVKTDETLNASPMGRHRSSKKPYRDTYLDPNLFIKHALNPFRNYNPSYYKQLYYPSYGYGKQSYNYGYDHKPSYGYSYGGYGYEKPSYGGYKKESEYGHKEESYDYKPKYEEYKSEPYGYRPKYGYGYIPKYGYKPKYEEPKYEKKDEYQEPKTEDPQPDGWEE